MNNSDILDLKNILNNPITNDYSDKNNLYDNSTKNNTNINNTSTANNSFTSSNNVIYNPNTLGNIFELLDNHNTKIKKSWSKLDKSNKIKIINNFIEKEKNDKSLCQDSVKQLKNMLYKALYNNLLNKQQDIVYDSEKNTIIKINSLKYNLETKTYEIIFKNKSGSRITSKSKSKTNVDRLINSNSNSKRKKK